MTSHDELDARDALTVTLVRARTWGIHVNEGRFRVGKCIVDRIADVRSDLRALEHQLWKNEERARWER